MRRLGLAILVALLWSSPVLAETVIINGVIVVTGSTIVNPAITGGTIDGTVIGGTTPAAGTFTGLTIPDGGILTLWDADDDFSVTLAVTDGTTKLRLTGNLDVSGDVIVGSDVSPDSSDGAAIGTTFAEWSDGYWADGAILYFGNDQDVTLTHTPDVGLAVNLNLYAASYGSDGSVSDTELKYINTLSSNAQTQIDGKQSISTSRLFPSTLSFSGTAYGDTITVTFGESVVFGDMVYPDATDNEWKKALATNAAVTYPGMGMVLESKGDSEVGQLLLRGVVRDDTIFAGASSGDIVFLSDATAGDVVYAAPADAGDIVQHLGFALGAGYIYFNPCYTYVER